MEIQSFLGDPKPINNWIDEASKNRGLGYWLVFEDEIRTDEISLSTNFYPIVVDAGDLTDEEFDEFEELLFNNGYSYLLNMDQIEDVIDNYTMQKSSPRKEELLEAILFYFSRDAFVCL
jgi:hypothetical protein